MRWILWLSLTAVIAIGQERFQLYTTENGLPNDSVLALLQARDGYLWFTTYGGIVRFDGLDFQVFDASNTPAIHSTTFVAFSLIEDRQGGIWAGAWSGGALRYHNGAFTSYTTRDGLPSNSVTRIDEDDNGDIWFYTASGLSRLHNGKVEAVRTIDGEPVQPYLKMPPTLGGDSHLFGLWRLARGASGLQRFARGKWSDVPLPPDTPDLAKLRMEITVEDSHGRLWYTIMGRPRESFCVEKERLTVYKGLPQGAFANYRDRRGRLWLTDQNGYTALWQDGRAVPLPGVSTSSPLRVLEDAEGGVWVGTLNQGLAHAAIQVIRSVRLPGGTEANVIRPITQDGQGNIWIGSYGLNRFHEGRFENYTLPHPWRSGRATRRSGHYGPIRMERFFSAIITGQ